MWSAAENEKRMRDGANFLTCIWEEVARKVVETAVLTYELTSEQADALRTVFLQRTPYRVEPS